MRFNEDHWIMNTRERNVIFVFGSNLAGRHGKGAALVALHTWGAQMGTGVGLKGRSYAIPTKYGNLKPMPLNEIAMYIYMFKKFARERQDLTFMVTRIGCGLAGYQDHQVAPMFRKSPDNVILPKVWKPLLEE